MFANDIALKTKTGTTLTSVSIVDLSQPGRSTRKSADASLVISGINTKENPGYKTKRLQIRLDRPVNPANVVLSNPTPKVSVGIIFSFPEDPNVDHMVLTESAAALMNFVFSGGNSGATPVSFDDGQFTSNISRLMVGEV